MSCCCNRTLTHPRDALGWSVVCDCGISDHTHLHLSVFLDCALSIIVIRFFSTFVTFGITVLYIVSSWCFVHVRIQQVFQRGSYFDNVFLFVCFS